MLTGRHGGKLPFMKTNRAAAVLVILTLSSATFLGLAAQPPGDASIPLPAAVEAERLALLEAELARHDALYFREGAPEITDREYDLLKAEWEELRARQGSRSSLSGERVSAGKRPLDPGENSLQHRVPMLSLKKVHDGGDLRAFHGRVEEACPGKDPGFVLEPKYDGVAVSLIYENGVFQRALSRGDGNRGEDLTRHLLAVGGFPLLLGTGKEVEVPAPEHLELRGEVFVPKAVFRRRNLELEERGEAAYATPRSLAAGSLQTGDPDEAKRRGLRLVLFGAGAWEPAASRPESQTAFLARLEAWKMPVPPHVLHRGEAADLHEAASRMAETLNEADIPTDGIVVKVNALACQRRLGTGSAFPNWAVACKFPGPTGETRLAQIRFQVGRSGLLTPVAEVDPLELGGRTVARISLYTAGYIRARDLRDGDRVRVELAGDSIPVMGPVLKEDRLHDSVPFAIPETCPVCGGLLEERGERLYCPSPDCSGKRLKQLHHFARSVGIGQLGEARLEALLEASLIEGPADFYHLHHHQEELHHLLGEGIAKQVLEGISASRSVEPWRVLTGLGIPGIGAATARRIMGIHGSFGNLVEALPREDGQSRSHLSGKTLLSLLAYGRSESGKETLERLSRVLSEQP